MVGADEDKRPVAEADSSVQAVAKFAEQELASLVRQQSVIAARIQQVKKTLSGLGTVFGQHALAKVLSEDTLQLLNYRKSNGRKRGLTNACRQAVREARRPLRAMEICAYLSQNLPEALEHHRSPSGSVVTIMNRLCAYGEVRPVYTSEGQRAWEAVGIAAVSAVESSEPREGTEDKSLPHHPARER